MEKFLQNFTLIFETLDYSGLNYVLLFEWLSKDFQNKFNARGTLEKINTRLRTNFYQNVDSLQVAKIEIKEITQPVLQTKVLYFVKSSKNLITMDLVDRTSWTFSLDDLPYSFHRHGTFQNYVLLDDESVFFCGERVEDDPSANVYVYNFANSTLETKPDLPTPRFFLGLARKHDIIYAFGGNRTITDILNVAEAFDLSTQTWSALPPCPSEIENATATAFKSLLYVTGCNVKCVYSYNPVSQEYQTTNLASPSITADKVLLPTPDRLILLTSRHNVCCLQGDGELGQEEPLNEGTGFLFGHAGFFENEYYFVNHQGDMKKVDPVMLQVTSEARISG